MAAASHSVRSPSTIAAAANQTAFDATAIAAAFSALRRALRPAGVHRFTLTSPNFVTVTRIWPQEEARGGRCAPFC